MNAWQAMNQWFAARARREKILISLALLVLVWLLMNQLWLAPVQQELQVRQQTVQTTGAELRSLRQEVSQLEQQVRRDPNVELREERDALQQRQASLNERLERNAQIMAAGASVGWLQALLDGSDAVQITNFDTLQPEPILSTEREDLAASGVNLYEHGVEITVEGDFHALRTYIERIESLPYNFYWQRLDYEVLTYPRARVQLTLYSLSTSREYIGV